jgi:hypothetical protein
MLVFPRILTSEIVYRKLISESLEVILLKDIISLGSINYLYFLIVVFENKPVFIVAAEQSHIDTRRIIEQLEIDIDDLELLSKLSPSTFLCIWDNDNNHTNLGEDSTIVDLSVFQSKAWKLVKEFIEENFI